MAIVAIFVYRLECDWPPGCPEYLVIHGAQSMEEAKSRARRDGWTVSKPYAGTSRGTTHARCPGHAYRPVAKRTGRRPRIRQLEAVAS